jgi:MoaA/NifB/PqqE/SkfB family radical SAM enzyme
MHNKEAVDFTGGEPTLYPELPSLISYARKIGFKTTCIITDGLLLAKKDKCLQLKEAGLTEVLFSIQGHNAETHDYLTGVKGSFSKLMQAISNAKKIGLSFRTNTVINSINYSSISKCMELLSNIQPSVANFLVFNPTAQAFDKVDEMSPSYQKFSAYIKESLDIYGNKIKKITVAFIPFCFMVGYEKHIRTMYQIHYDQDEWDNLLDIKFKKGPLFTAFSIIMGLILLLSNPYIYSSDWKAITCDAVMRIKVFKDRVKARFCKKCKYYYICAGFPREYVKIKGVNELSPVSGKKVIDPNYYRKFYER